MCVQDVDVQCVLQFTLIHAAGCALHRRASRVIHCPKLFKAFFARLRMVKHNSLWQRKSFVFGNVETRPSPFRAAARAAPLFKPNSRCPDETRDSVGDTTLQSTPSESERGGPATRGNNPPRAGGAHTTRHGPTPPRARGARRGRVGPTGARPPETSSDGTRNVTVTTGAAPERGG